MSHSPASLSLLLSTLNTIHSNITYTSPSWLVAIRDALDTELHDTYGYHYFPRESYGRECALRCG